jgi:hypothetical protein
MQSPDDDEQGPTLSEPSTPGALILNDANVIMSAFAT